MSEALDWVRLILSLCLGLANLALLFWFLSWIMAMVGKGMGAMGNPVLSRYTPSPRVLARRIWCKHYTVMRGRDPYGRLFTACARCAKDVNAGKEKWEWR